MRCRCRLLGTAHRHTHMFRWCTGAHAVCCVITRQRERARCDAGEYLFGFEKASELASPISALCSTPGAQKRSRTEFITRATFDFMRNSFQLASYISQLLLSPILVIPCRRSAQLSNSAGGVESKRTILGLQDVLQRSSDDACIQDSTTDFTMTVMAQSTSSCLLIGYAVERICASAPKLRQMAVHQYLRVLQGPLRLA